MNTTSNDRENLKALRSEDWTMRRKPMPIDAELTIEGLLKFANDHAVDTGSC